MEFITNPQEIEANSFRIITQLLGDKNLDSKQENIIKRVIHTTADFDYADNLIFSENAVDKALAALKAGAHIVTDTQMAKAGVNKSSLAKLGGEVLCFIGSEEVANAAKEKGVTRAGVAVEYAVQHVKAPVIFAVGNAPTALIKLYEIIKEGREDFAPALIIGAPVGFVNVEESKELIRELDTPYIIARGRKGGSNVAAAICNALLYTLVER